MLMHHSEPNQLYQERLRRAADGRLAREFRRRTGRPQDKVAFRRSVGELLINAGLRMCGEFPGAVGPVSRRAA
ncbi:hypothetical protein [Microlunatus soli]|uniref:Uncharacterized protein n=1 Tax=Microlunatus soli TaxID=630515 RepID=A0A1H1V8V1_9ACTN|nr:hypothetical protein [Microlunatus soli]SDS80679.1 hypothetical protein SAMN04489812_3096 [Microlunatus soli]